MQDAVREDFGHLPPEQRRKALHKKVQELEKEQTVQQRVSSVHARPARAACHVYLMLCIVSQAHPGGRFAACRIPRPP